VRAIDALGEAPALRASLAAHAPYSVAPSVFDEILAEMARRAPLPCSVHLSESAEEVRFLADAGGPWRALLDDVGAWDPRWRAPATSPVRYLDAAGFLSSRVVAVHGVQMDQSDLAILAHRETTLVTCPRSNRHTGAGTPPVAAFYASGVPIAVGTDSLASAPDLNLFAELAALRAIAPDVPASRLLESATRIGATALGCGASYGTIEAGKRARLLAVAVPPDEVDVEEFLVGGIGAAEIRWLA
jgi:cytosine/adenosine deaminase-related metal-dependent hydrolase